MATVKIYGTLKNKAGDGVVTTTADIQDEEYGARQSEVNRLLKATIDAAAQQAGGVTEARFQGRDTKGSALVDPWFFIGEFSDAAALNAALDGFSELRGNDLRKRSGRLRALLNGSPLDVWLYPVSYALGSFRMLATGPVGATKDGDGGLTVSTSVGMMERTVTAGVAGAWTHSGGAGDFLRLGADAAEVSMRALSALKADASADSAMTDTQSGTAIGGLLLDLCVERGWHLRERESGAHVSVQKGVLSDGTKVWNLIAVTQRYGNSSWATVWGVSLKSGVEGGGSALVAAKDGTATLLRDDAVTAATLAALEKRVEELEKAATVK